MPEHTNQGGEDLYADAAVPAAAKDQGGQPEKSDESGETALLPKNICPGMKPGDELVLKVLRVLDDQYEVKYQPEPKDEEEPPAEEPKTASPMPGRGEMASLMED